MNKHKCGVYSIERKILRDTRGWFLKATDGMEPGNPFPCEVYFTAALPGESKGGHYHREASEWFTLVKGEARLELNDTSTNESLTMNLSADQPVTVFVPPGVAHKFINTGDTEFLLVAFTDKTYNPEDTLPNDPVA